MLQKFLISNILFFILFLITVSPAEARPLKPEDISLPDHSSGNLFSSISPMEVMVLSNQHVLFPLPLNNLIFAETLNENNQYIQNDPIQSRLFYFLQHVPSHTI